MPNYPKRESHECTLVTFVKPRCGDRVQPVEADQPFGRRRPALQRDIAVPAAQLPIARDEPLPHGERLAFIPVHHRDLAQAAATWPKRVHGLCAFLCFTRRMHDAAS